MGLPSPLKLQGFRAHPLDGAMLWFHPRLGLNLRWDAPATHKLRRVAPRVVLFAITNRCNLACDFCSRDPAAPSTWTVESAFQTLADFAQAGVLEVAFGGGEPLAFRGFDALIERLGRDTPLALHLTTNGELLTPDRAARLAPHLGEVRLSVYPQGSWAERIALLVRSGVVVGANLLATPATVPALPAVLRRLADLGCHDAAILRYVGHDPALHLDAQQESELSQIILQSPLRVRVSACFGSRLHALPLLFPGVDGDCGAGRDFLVVTSDKRLKACSFQDTTVPFTTVADALVAYATQRPILDAAAGRPGCARPLPRAASLSAGLRLWRGFSGNNSSDCILVGRFGQPEAAEAFLAQLLPGYQPGRRTPQSWLELFSAQGLAASECYPPDNMVTLGRSLLLHTDSSLTDDFVPLRALLWRRGGRSVCNGVFGRSEVRLLAGIKLPNQAALPTGDALLRSAGLEPLGAQGTTLFSSVRVAGPSGCKYALDTCVDQVRKVATSLGGRTAGELVDWDDTPAARLLRRPSKHAAEWLWVSFKEPAAAAAFVHDLGSRPAGPAAESPAEPAVLGGCVLVRSRRVGPRLGWMAARRGGVALLLQGPQLRIRFQLQKEQPPDGSSSGDAAERLRTTLRAFLAGQETAMEVGRADGYWTRGSIVSSAPDAALAALGKAAQVERVELAWLRVEAAEPLVQSLARISRELSGQREG